MANSLLFQDPEVVMAPLPMFHRPMSLDNSRETSLSSGKGGGSGDSGNRPNLPPRGGGVTSSTNTLSRAGQDNTTKIKTVITLSKTRYYTPVPTLPLLKKILERSPELTDGIFYSIILWRFLKWSKNNKNIKELKAIFMVQSKPFLFNMLAYWPRYRCFNSKILPSRLSIWKIFIIW